MTENYDCIVLGGGPAGSTAAALVAEAGFRTLQLEREKMPRFHVGESLMPETYWTLKRLGVLDQMKSSRFPKKYSVQFVSHSGRESQPFYFQDVDPRECAQTWQVDRSTFDHLLWKNAAAKGAVCRDQTRVLSVLFDGDRAYGVKLQTADGRTEEIRARVVVDATGVQSLVANSLGLREVNPRLRKAAIWGYYRGGRRDPGIDEGATLILHTRDKQAWFWYIPLPDDLVSVGVVGDTSYLLKGRGKPATVFEEELVNCPAVVDRLMQARLDSEFRVLREFSYTSSRAAGPGWVLIGDAFSFLDPIYSSGVFLALKSGELAADCIMDGLRTDNLSGEQLGSWTGEFLEGMNWICKLVYAFYSNDFSFGRFIKKYPHHKNNLTDLLVGKVFHPTAGKIFDDMAPYLSGERSQVEDMAQQSKDAP